MTFSSLALAVGLLGCIAAPPSGSAGPGAATTTEWKEGYGGDSIAIEARQIVENACFRSRRLRSPLINRVLETDRPVVEDICGLLNSGQLIIESIEQPVVDGVQKDAANYPEARPRRMSIKKGYWTNPATTADAKEGLVLHELFPLIGLGDKDYVRSSRLQLALDSSRGTLTDVSCDIIRLQAQFAGATSEISRSIIQVLGQERCAAGVQLVVDGASSGTFDEKLASDLSHTYLVGLFQGLAKAPDENVAAQFHKNISDSLVRLPNAFGRWSTEVCKITTELKNRPSCEGFLTLLIGATRRQKTFFTGPDQAPLAFERASLNLLVDLRMSKEPKILVAFLASGLDGKAQRVSGADVNEQLVHVAILAQNWLHLDFLGQLQRDLRPGELASSRIFKRINWSHLLSDVEENLQQKYSGPGSGYLTNCMPTALRRKAEAVVDGDISKIRCENAFII